jgi:hypothetical protein
MEWGGNARQMARDHDNSVMRTRGVIFDQRKTLLNLPLTHPANFGSATTASEKVRTSGFSQGAGLHCDILATGRTECPPAPAFA